MARKIGKKRDVKLDPLAYNHGLAGESGIGKTTLLKEYCEKMGGDESYIHYNMGKEDGADAIQGIISHDIESWADMEEAKSEIIENRNTDYKDLRVILYDTVDELIPIAEAEIIRRWNNKQRKLKDGKLVDTINAAHGGFMRGQDEAFKLIADYLWDLKKVGISFFLVFHTKKRTKTDPVTEQSYDVISSKIEQRYFEHFKTKLHFLGFAYVDRSIEEHETGRKVNGKKETKGSITGEKRIISFRDEGFSVDSKSRFADIIDKIPLDVDEYHEALVDAIRKEASKKKGGKSLEERADEQAKVAEKNQQDALEEQQAKLQDDKEQEKKDKLKVIYKELVSKADANDKKLIKETMVELDINLKEWDNNELSDLKKFIKKIKNEIGKSE